MLVGVSGRRVHKCHGVLVKCQERTSVGHSEANRAFCGQGLVTVPDPTEYKGIVIAKRKSDRPLSEEPVVFAYARMVQHRRPVVGSDLVLGLVDDRDRVDRRVKRRVERAQSCITSPRSFLFYSQHLE